MLCTFLLAGCGAGFHAATRGITCKPVLRRPALFPCSPCWPPLVQDGGGVCRHGGGAGAGAGAVPGGDAGGEQGIGCMHGLCGLMMRCLIV